MKLASIKSSVSRDGELVVVSRDNQTAAKATHIAPSLRDALENWAECAPKLESLFNDLQAGPVAETLNVSTLDTHSTLTRAFQWVDG